MTTTYSYDDAYAALCIWEEIINPVMLDAEAPWQAMRNSIGTAALRDMALQLAGPSNAAWNLALAACEREHSQWGADLRMFMRLNNIEQSKDVPLDWHRTNPMPEGPGAFDWEFLPFWLRTAVDWSGDVPRVRGKLSRDVTRAEEGTS